MSRFNVSSIFAALQLAAAVASEVHAVEAALPGQPGAAKSQAVIDKITPIANVVGAEAGNIQSLIDGFVGIYNAVGAFAHAPAAPASPAA